MKNIFRFIFVVTVFLWITPKNSYAYIDPGTGSYVIQILIASVLGGAFALKGFYKKYIELFKTFFTRKKSNKIDE